MNLFICVTTLQCFIAENIIRNYKLDKSQCELLMLAPVKNSLYEKYFQRLAAGMQKSEYLLVDRDKKISFVKEIFRIKKKYKNRCYNTVFLSSIEQAFIQIILSQIEFDHLITFDDGTANLNKNGVFYKNNRSTKGKIILSLFGNRFDLNKLKQRIDKHITIYKTNNNIVSNLEFLDLGFLSKFNNKNTDRESVKKIVIGTVYDEMVAKKEDKIHLIKLLENFFSKSNDVLYFPHPRDKTHYFKSIKYVEKDLLVEEALMDLSQNYSKIEIFGFLSSAQFNLEAQNKFQQYYFVSSLLRKDLKDLMKLAESLSFKAYDLD